MGKGSAGSKPLIEIKYNYDALEEFVASVKDRFSEHEARIVALEQQQVVLAGKNSALERTLLQREEEIRVLRGECKQLAQQAVEVEEQNFSGCEGHFINMSLKLCDAGSIAGGCCIAGGRDSLKAGLAPQTSTRNPKH